MRSEQNNPMHDARPLDPVGEAKCHCGGDPCVGPGTLRAGYYCAQVGPQVGPVDDKALCVACGNPANEYNSYADADGSYQLIRFERFAVCYSCIPWSNETLLGSNAEMEPEEAALRCWYHRVRYGSTSFEEVAESLMDWTARTTAAASAAHHAQVRAAMQKVRKPSASEGAIERSEYVCEDGDVLHFVACATCKQDVHDCLCPTWNAALDALARELGLETPHD